MQENSLKLEERVVIGQRKRCKNQTENRENELRSKTVM